MSLSLIIAHPDDESWAFATLLCAAEALAWPLRILCLTSGDAGVDLRPNSKAEARATSESLAQVREAELRRATAQLDTSVDITFARLLDGKLPAQSASIQELLRDWWDAQSVLTATWGPAGGYGHVDHVACYDACAAFLGDKNAPFWTAHFPWKAAQTVHQRLIRYRSGALAIPSFQAQRARENARIQSRVNLLKKRQLLAEHTTQVGSKDVDRFVHPALTGALLKHEYFDTHGATHAAHEDIAQRMKFHSFKD